MKVELQLTPKSIQEGYIQLCSLHLPEGTPLPHPLILDPKEGRLALLSLLPVPSFEWADLKSMSPAKQNENWLLREYVFAQILLCCLPSLEHAPKYTILRFGSTTLTSDIDATVEGPSPSHVIEALEDFWVKQLSSEPGVWDIEYYGDFLTVVSPEGRQYYLNTRTPHSHYRAPKLLMYAGVSVLRNGVSLDNEELNAYLAHFPDYPFVKQKGWKDAAKKKYETIQKKTFEEQRQNYYKALKAAEAIRAKAEGTHRPILPQEYWDMFFSLCEANLYRSENYILPSTVIHIVRGYQSGNPLCDVEHPPPPYKVEAPECSLGDFTYFCSGIEQLGYKLRFKGDTKKEEKYGKRIENVMVKHARITAHHSPPEHLLNMLEGGGGGGRRPEAKRKTRRRHRAVSRRHE